MDRNDIITARSLKKDHQIMAIHCDDNMTFFWGPAKNNNSYWDDENELLYVIRPNISAHSQASAPAEIMIISYENIQYFTLRTNYIDTVDFLKNNISLNDEQINTAIKNLEIFGTNRNIAVSQPHSHKDSYADGVIKPQE